MAPGEVFPRALESLDEATQSRERAPPDWKGPVYQAAPANQYECSFASLRKISAWKKCGSAPATLEGPVAAILLYFQVAPHKVLMHPNRCALRSFRLAEPSKYGSRA